MRAVDVALAAVLLSGAASHAASAPATPASPPPNRRAGPPAWARDAVWYQVFPERFRNGDPHNDPGPADLRGAWPHDPIVQWRVSPWTSDWYKLQPWERATGRDFYYNAQLRRYGGDLQGLIEKLDYIQGLGVNALYLNPVFESPSLHRYDTTFYHHVDNNLGPDPQGDRLLWATEDPGNPATWKWTAADRLFLRLVQECHRRRIRLVIDGVFNHVGVTFWAFRDARARGARSRYAEWFAIKRFDDPQTPADELEYEGWAGVRELPELKKDGDTLAAGPRAHIRAIVKRWGDPNGDGDPADGVDGWRLDVADRVGRGFWRELRSWVLEINPDAYLVGEVFWQDWAGNKMWNPEPWLRGDAFDGVMNYRFADAVKAFFADRASALTTTDFDRRLAQLRSEVRPEMGEALMNLLDSHDTDRFASQVVNPDRFYDHQGSPKDEARYDVRAPKADEWRRVRAAAAFQFAYPGAPMVYYGTEAGMWGADDPDARKPMLWSELKYEDEATHPLGGTRPSDPVRFDASLFEYYRTLGGLRAARPALRRGAYETLLADDATRLFVFSRVAEDDRIVAAFNGSDMPQVVDVSAPVPVVRDLLTGKRLTVKDGKVRLTLPPFGAAYVGGELRAAE